MRTALALRTSIVTAALAGAMLIPAAGSAFAAAPAAAVPTSVAAASEDEHRYEGEPVYIGEGLVAVLRNKSEGPEAWIRSVGTGWKPGDNYMFRVITKLDADTTTASASGLKLKLTGTDTEVPVLTVTAKDGSKKSYKLPKAEVTAICVSGPKRVVVGGGTRAELWMTVNGPKVDLYASGEKDVLAVLDRKNPAWHGESVRIVNPSGAAPVLRWYMEGDGTKPGTASFPALQPGCIRNYELVDDKATTPPAPKPTPAATKPKTGGQTSVVPKGPVAAGAEFPATAGDGDSPAYTAGAGLLAAVGALVAGVALRRRSRTQG